MKRLLIALLLALLALILWLARPLPVHGLESRSHPSRDYAEALRRVTALEDEDSPAIAPGCRTLLLTHGHATARVIVLLHGLTNCPAQFDSIARLSFGRGANVLVPRLPRHGRSDRMTNDLALMNADELREFTDRALDAARGLGDSMTVAGLSVGGTLAAWAAVERRDVDRAVLIAPLFGVAVAPGLLTPMIGRLAGLAPNVFMWWDPRAKQNLGGPRLVYPRFSTRSIAATLQIGAVTLERARREGAACRSLAVVTVGSDLAVDNGQSAELVRVCRDRGNHDVETYEFPKALGLNHDVVDPDQLGGRPALTYPVLMRYIGP
jgi:pimeloyl-ACP methyl ester carboxylesterase